MDASAEKSNSKIGCTLFQVPSQLGLPLNCDNTLIVQRNVNRGMQKLRHNLDGDLIEPSSLLHDRILRLAAATEVLLLVLLQCLVVGAERRG